MVRVVCSLVFILVANVPHHLSPLASGVAPAEAGGMTEVRKDGD